MNVRDLIAYSKIDIKYNRKDFGFSKLFFYLRELVSER